MSPLAITAIATLAAAIGLFSWALLVGPDRKRQQAVSNLQRGMMPDATSTSNAAAQNPKPATSGKDGKPGKTQALTQRMTPDKSMRLLERLYIRAGRPPSWPMERLIASKLIALFICTGLALLLLNAALVPLTLIVAIILPIVGYFLPELLLHSRAQERSQEIGLELADTLDQMTIAVEAGLGFDSAMARAGKNGTGPLAQELVRTLQDIQVGQSRREAYRALASRTDVVDLRRFVRAVIQADEHGVSIADVLRTQADQMRLKRRQRAEEKAMQIPVKVIFPLMLCILPVLFIVLMGPAVMDIIDAFS